MDTKKKELVGDFKNAGWEWRAKGKPHRVRVHDFLIPRKGKAIPYGVYDLTRDEGWVNVGIDHDTGMFAVESVRRWWKTMGEVAPKARTYRYAAEGATEKFIPGDIPAAYRSPARSVFSRCR